MIESLKISTSHLIEKYIDILEKNGEPDEIYKYAAIDTFQDNWDLDTEDFYQMFRLSFFGRDNLLHQIPWGFIDKTARYFPEETREMFRNLYDESVNIEKRLLAFQQQSEFLLSQLKEKLNRENLSAQQDERTISLYLAFRYPEKYILYKSDYYKKFCKQIGINPKKAGERYFHFQQLADQIIEEGLLNESITNTYRKFYPKPNWDDKYLMIQNVLYVVFRDDLVDNQEAIIWKEALEYAYNQIHTDPWDKNEKFKGYAIEYGGVLYPNKYIYRHSVKYIGDNYPDFQLLVPSKAKNGKPLNDFLKSKGANAITINDYHTDIMKKNTSQTYIPLNQILFGAPGTGKTYHTKRIAVEIINGVRDRTREEINKEYEELVNAKQIVFTTFHQSLSYEDFIEGIKPEAIDGNVTYEVKDGIFKHMCHVAKSIAQESISNSNIDFENCNYYKMSLGGKHRLEKHNWSIENDLIFLGWGDDKDFTELNKINDWTTFRTVFKQKYPELVEDSRFVIQAVYIFQKMKIGDIVIISKGNRIIDAIGVIESEYFYDDTKEIENYQFRKVKWIAKDLNMSSEVLLNIGLSQQTIYQLNIKDVRTDVLNGMFNKTAKDKELKNYVLIIDEINRGNVSAIFGELITLLEEDKRKGNKEQTEVILPYSNDKFSVPNNVYIIGTMNTADRSVEALDTALRRRFSFTEMQPNPEILLDSEYQDVNLKQLLETINQRIEVLIDKDHQIGHSYFIGIENLNDLKQTFKDKIIPLLEEYFYGDFGKIGLVLGGNLIYQEENTAKFPKNFTYENDFVEDKKVYRFTPSENWEESTFISVYED